MTRALLPHQATFYFYGVLRDFLKASRLHQPIPYRFDHSPGIKDPIEALGVPHTEVEQINVNGRGVTFSYQLRHGDRVDVYPLSPGEDSESGVPLRPPLQKIAFVLDVHLGKLARLLRMLGFDTWYRNDYEDPELVDIAEREQRVLLTRDRRLLFHRRVVHGHFVRHDDALEQAKEIIDCYQLEADIASFSRCVRCNGCVAAVEKDDIYDLLEPKTQRYYYTFYRCEDCGQIYWRGSHFNGIMEKFRTLGLVPPASGIPEKPE